MGLKGLAKTAGPVSSWRGTGSGLGQMAWVANPGLIIPQVTIGASLASGVTGESGDNDLSLATHPQDPW